MTHTKVLIVQNHETGTTHLEECLHRLGFVVCAVVSSGRQAMEHARGLQPDVALIDLGLGAEIDGFEVADRLGSRFDIPVVYLTDGTDDSRLQRAQTTRPYAYVLKPVDPQQLHLNLKTALALHEQNLALRENIRGLRRTIDAQQRKHRNLEAIFNHFREGVVVIDPKGHLVFANNRAEQLMGSLMDPDPAFGEPPEASEQSESWGIFKLDKATYVPADALPSARALRGLDTDDMEVFTRNEKRPYGAYVNLSGRTLWREDKSEIEGAVIFFRDISRIKQAEDRLEQTMAGLHDQGQLLGTIFDSVNEGLIIAGATGQPVRFNRRAGQLLKLEQPQPDLGPTTWAERYGLFCSDQETFLPVDQNPLVRAMRGESVDRIEVFVRNAEAPDGRHMSVSGRPLLNQDEEVRGGVVVFRDVTEDKRAEAELRRVVAELREQSGVMETVLNGIRDGVVAVDATGRVLLTNSRVEEIVGTIADARFGELKDASSRQEKYGIFELDMETYVPTETLPLVRALRGVATDDQQMWVRNERKPQGTYVSVGGRPLWNEERSEVIGAMAFFRDITKDKRTEADLQQTIIALRDQTQLMETVFDSMNEGVIAVDKNGKHLICNASAQQIGGLHKPHAGIDQWTQKYGVFCPDGETPLSVDDNPLVRATRGEATDGMQLFVQNEQKPQGTHISVSGRPLLREDGALRGGVIVVRDVTKEKWAEVELQRTITELRDQSQLMKTVFDSMEEGVAVVDRSGQFLLTNAQREHIIGVKATASEPAEWASLYGVFHLDKSTHVSPHEFPAVRALQGEASETELFVRNANKPDGVYIKARGRPLEDGNVYKGAVVIFSDITRYKMTEAKLEQTISDLRQQNELMETTFNSISDGIIFADIAGKFLYVNPVGEEIIGVGSMKFSDARLGEKWGTYYYPDRETPIDRDDLPLLRAMFDGESTDEMDMFVRNQNKPDGVYVRVSARPLLDTTGGIRGGVVIFRDVTEQMVVDEALTRAFAQGRLEVLDTVLHNIGNAILSVTVGVDTLHRNLVNDRLLRLLRVLVDTIEEHQDDWTDYVRRNPQGRKVVPVLSALAEDFARQNKALVQTVERVRDRANHISDIVRTQKTLGSRRMDRKTINLEEAISTAVKVLQDSLTMRNVKIDVDCEYAPQEIRIQESQFHQTLVNLIKNAMEAIDDLAASAGLREAPYIHIRAYVKESFLHVDVSDNGIGIDRKNRRILFAAGYTTKKSGTGLGLHSAANFVIGSGGQIQPLSDGSGLGATMRILFRLSSVAPGGGGTPHHLSR